MFALTISLFDESWCTKLLSSSILTTIKLEDIIEVDEFYIKAGFQGRSYHDEIQKLGRQPRKRGLRSCRGSRGTFYKSSRMITGVHQRRNGLTYFDVPAVKNSLLDIVCN